MLNLCDFIQVYVFSTNHHLICVTSCARVRNCWYMYLEKRLFVGISTLLQALCLGGGRGRGGGGGGGR